MTIPTYPSGQIGFIIASRQENSIKTKSTCQILVRMTTTKMVQALQYYTTELYSVAFVLPTFAKKAIMM